MEEFTKEIAKMLIDIMKYLITGIMLTTIFGNFEDQLYVYAIGFSLVILCGVTASMIYQDIENKNRKRRK